MAVTTRTSGRLAGSMQEALTAVVRLRADRQSVNDAVAFRAQMLQLLTRAEQDALQLGHTTQDARIAIFAIVAFLDESVLNARVPALAEWARRPLQDELFGGHMGGEWFFQHIDQLLARPDSTALADLLEVYQLCMLLGFRGKYGTSESTQLHAITTRVSERLNHIRSLSVDLAPHWQPPADKVETRDPWVRPLAIGAIGAVGLLVLLWGAYSLSLRSGTGRIRSMAPVSLSPAASMTSSVR